MLTAEESHADDVLDTPPTVAVESITAFGVTLRVTVRTQALRNGAVAQALRAGSSAAFDAAGIASPGLSTASVSAAADEPSNPD